MSDLEASEPARLDAAADRYSKIADAMAPSVAKFRLVSWACQARKAAATLRAMRAARLRLNYSQRS